MIVQQITSIPRYIRDEHGEIVVSEQLAVGIYAETKADEFNIRKFLRDNI